MHESELPTGPRTIAGGCNVSTAGDKRIPEYFTRWYQGLHGRVPHRNLQRSWRLRNPLRLLLDPLDEHRARRLRTTFGRRHWLVSWQPEGDGRWCARLSCPSLVFTLE